MANGTQANQESLVWNVYPDCARALNLSKATCWKMVHAGKIPSVRLGKRVLISKQAVLDLLASQQPKN